MPPKTQSSIKVKRIYSKGSSFQPKNQPSIYSQTGKCTHQLQIQVSHRALPESDCYEASLVVIVNAKIGDFDAYQVQVAQAGEFELKGFNEASKKQALETICLNMIYPFAMQAVADLVMKGNFTQLTIASVDFVQIYKERLAQQRVQPSAAGIFSPVAVASPGAAGESEGGETFFDPGDLPTDATRPGT